MSMASILQRMLFMCVYIIDTVIEKLENFEERLVETRRIYRNVPSSNSSPCQSSQVKSLKW